ncbi:MAG TPA: phosphotransferase family protein [Trebonia sp.]|jgi:aminoglycoside phosphotransferase (APT) family kinase protein|nr:phosphotransferase family protein [Trebonia sp.]
MAVGIADPDLLRERLTRWLPGPLGTRDGKVTALSVESVTAPRTGQSNETVFVEARWLRNGTEQRGSYVARMQPRMNQMFIDADVVREAKLIARLGDVSPVAVPRIRAIEEDPSALGVPFFLMDKVDGHVPAGSPSVHVDPWIRAMTASQRRTLLTNAQDVLPQIHRVAPPEVAGILDASPEAATAEADIGRLRRWYDWARRGRAFPVLDQAMGWLEAGAGNASEPVLLWGDPRPGNMIFTEELTVAAVLDWEIASVGPPELDLGWWLTMDEFARRGAEDRELDGFPSDAEIVRRYEAVSGRRAGDLDFYRLVAAVKLAITLIPAMDSLIARSILAADTRFAHDNVPTQIVARLLGIPEPALCQDYRRLSRMSKVRR